MERFSNVKPQGLPGAHVGGFSSIEPEFKEKVLEDRGATYGDYRVNMTCVAEFWTSYLKARFGATFALTPSDVPVMMQLLKEGRIATGKYHPDNQQDIRGYGELYDKLNQEKKDV